MSTTVTVPVVPSVLPSSLIFTVYSMLFVFLSNDPAVFDIDGFVTVTDELSVSVVFEPSDDVIVPEQLLTNVLSFSLIAASTSASTFTA